MSTDLIKTLPFLLVLYWWLEKCWDTEKCIVYIIVEEMAEMILFPLREGFLDMQMRSCDSSRVSYIADIHDIDRYTNSRES